MELSFATIYRSSSIEVSHMDRERYRTTLMSLVVASDVVSQRHVYRVLAMLDFYHCV
jgi:uncharacterized protein YaeQ